GLTAVSLTCALWWSYFPYIRPELEEALVRRTGADRASTARDVFSLSHFPMLCGVIGVAAALEVAIGHPHDSMAIGARASLAAGLVLFLAGTAIAEWRATGKPRTVRLLLVGLTAVLVLVIAAVPSYVSLLIGLAGTVVVVVLEHRAHRHRTRPAAA
ncbi:MAG: low temperature requirement protein A, partial [Rhodothermales bacterium]|nr:low temperature requirement protein A [Rhodothermales bacterium]